MEVVFFFLILLIMCSIASSETDTLKQGDVLNSSESTFLVSANKTFTLGFFTPEKTNRTYLAIWFTLSKWNEPVWIGNRENPLPKNSPAKLFIDASGRLILTPYYQLSSKKTSLNVTATLLDSGNLVLREINAAAAAAADGLFGRELWSSFDNPTDTLLPGMKLGVNHRTGRNWTLTSWLRDDAPGSGAFSLEWDPTRTRLVIKNRGVVRWTSGELTNATNFQHSPTHTSTFDGVHNFNFVNVSTNGEQYFRYAVTLDPSDLPFISSAEQIKFRLAGWRLDPRGLLYVTYNGTVIIDVGDCYGYEDDSQQAKGCELWKQPKCRGGGETFKERSGSFVNYTGEESREFVTKNSSASLSDCRENCWKDCDCVGYQGNDEGCVYWRGTSLQFQQDYSGRTVTKFVLDRPIKEGNDSNSSSNSKKWLKILIPIVIGTAITVLLGLLQLRRRRKERDKKEQELKDLFTLEEYSDVHELDKGESSNLKVFSYDWTIATTNNFSPQHKLGQGGFGGVYKGVTPEGQEVAIKQLSERSKQGVTELKNEVVLIAKLQHTNLVKLLGFCIHGDTKMLIYEFMPNKSLDFFLFDPNRKQRLTWERRLNIIEGTAQGLLYLHKYSRVRIIHRDVKASNILLDENMNPKISDFGMARILRQNATEAKEMNFGGTRGYMAPEYVKKGIFSTKSDVYNFGILVLEIVSGRKNNYVESEDGPLNLVEHAWELWNRDGVLQLVDPTISNMCGNEEQLYRCINMGLLCVEELAIDRPSMSDVISMLTNENLALPKPKKPAFLSRCNVADGFQEDRSNKFTVNELSISVIEAR